MYFIIIKRLLGLAFFPETSIELKKFKILDSLILSTEALSILITALATFNLNFYIPIIFSSSVSFIISLCTFKIFF